MENKEKLVQASVIFEEEEHIKIKMFCVENKISLQDFIRNSTNYCLEKKIIPKNKKRSKLAVSNTNR